MGVLFLTGLLLVAVGGGEKRINGEMDNAEGKTMTGDAAVENLLLEVSILRSENAILRAHIVRVAHIISVAAGGDSFVYRGGMKGELRVDVDTISISAEAAMFGARRNPSNICLCRLVQQRDAI